MGHRQVRVLLGVSPPRVRWCCTLVITGVHWHGALLARPSRLPKLWYRCLGSTDRSPLVASPEGANGATSGAHVCYSA